MHLSINLSKLRPAMACLLLTLTFNLSAQISVTDWNYSSINPKEKTASLAFLVSLDTEKLYQQQSLDTQVEMWLPDPTGQLAAYRLTPTVTVHPSVAHHYQIKTYRGHKLDNPSSKISCAISPEGLQASILAGKNSFVIESNHHSDVHSIYYSSVVPAVTHRCAVASIESVIKSTTQKLLIPDTKKLTDLPS